IIKYVLLLLVYDLYIRAEDGIRDDLVTRVQTCALPIYVPDVVDDAVRQHALPAVRQRLPEHRRRSTHPALLLRPGRVHRALQHRSEERRVGKECLFVYSLYLCGLIVTMEDIVTISAWLE